MSQENVKVVQSVYEAWLAEDFESVFEHFDPDIEWFDRMGGGGTGAEWRGHDGVRASLSSFLGTWEGYQFELRELIDSGDHVLAVGWQRGLGRGSGVEVSGDIFSVWTLRAGKVIRQRMFTDRTEALEAVGLTG